MSKISGLKQMCASALKHSKPALAKFKYYAKVELVPPKMSDIPAIRRDISSLISAAKNKEYLNLTVKEAWLNTLVTIEVIGWFFIGECIGKGRLAGYKV